METTTELYLLPHAYQLVYEYMLAGYTNQPNEEDIKASHEYADNLIMFSTPAAYAVLTDEWLQANPSEKPLAMRYALAAWSKWIDCGDIPFPEDRLPLYVQEFINRIVLEMGGSK